MKRGWIRKSEVQHCRKSKLHNFSKAQAHVQFAGRKYSFVSYSGSRQHLIPDRGWPQTWGLRVGMREFYLHQFYLLQSPMEGFPGGPSGKEPTCQCRSQKRHGFNPWVGKIPLEGGMATHSSLLAWRIRWTEEPGGLQCIELQRVRHD